MIKRGVPVTIAVVVGLVTLMGLLLPASPLSGPGNSLMRWAAFLAAFALLLGVLNLFAVHLSRLFRGNFYSGVLAISMVTVILLGFTDLLGLTSGGTAAAFDLVQVPLEAAFASLLAFFLLFAGFQMLRQRRGGWTFLFIATAIFILVSRAFSTATFLPASLLNLLEQVTTFLDQVVVTSGVRGLLIGVALGTITLTIRLLAGAERPYNQ